MSILLRGKEAPWQVAAWAVTEHEDESMWRYDFALRYIDGVVIPLPIADKCDTSSEHSKDRCWKCS